jgi:hypothetical protein
METGPIVVPRYMSTVQLCPIGPWIVSLHTLGKVDRSQAYLGCSLRLDRKNMHSHLMSLV